MVGIDAQEKDQLVLLSTLGQKGPSSFIFTPVYKTAITAENIISFRKSLKLSIREFGILFDISPATITRLENKNICGKDIIKRLQIYIYFPEVALHEINKNRFKINDESFQFAEDYFKDKLKK